MLVISSIVVIFKLVIKYLVMEVVKKLICDFFVYFSTFRDGDVAFSKVRNS